MRFTLYVSVAAYKSWPFATTRNLQLQPKIHFFLFFFVSVFFLLPNIRYRLNIRQHFLADNSFSAKTEKSVFGRSLPLDNKKCVVFKFWLVFYIILRFHYDWAPPLIWTNDLWNITKYTITELNFPNVAGNPDTSSIRRNFLAESCSKRPKRPNDRGRSYTSAALSGLCHHQRAKAKKYLRGSRTTKSKGSRPRPNIATEAWVRKEIYVYTVRVTLFAWVAIISMHPNPSIF
jgi:hypothetical protein